ncbi:hypothetical protein [Paenibacillus sp. OV219]|uniref:hypothetical protein n=1 Tax=Paenibacillus sp. OV219 TaxID=1884377 RepID=UPI0008CB528E|nr:hypothetical protein [Paenibacillus sp. OV219]SEN06796.1 hypothetical protein SAMN05518847_10278 [Paenibacillus sp. OV219]
MKVGIARQIASEWFHTHASTAPEFIGAYFSGSTVEMPDDALLPAASDIDLIVVTEEAEPPLKLGKFISNGALLEVTYLAWRQLSSYEEVLTNYHLAGSFRVNTIIADPSGNLRELQKQVASRFADEYWVRKRCEDVLSKIRNGLQQNLPSSAPLETRVNSWLFPTGVMTHLLLVAALRNPTVRCRYAAVREVLETNDCLSVHEELLALLGCGQLSAARIQQHVLALADTFDIAASIAKTPFFFSSDITPASRHIAIDGSLELIESGLHREAVFWIAATFARCHAILSADAPQELLQRCLPAFEALLADLGARTDVERRSRADAALRYLPKLQRTAERIMTAIKKTPGQQL